jgi:hypothetical protein
MGQVAARAGADAAMVDAPMVDDRLLARVVRHGGFRLIDRAVARLLPPPGQTPRRSLSQRLANAALLRIAMGSVPGAIVVGGGLLARHFHLRRKEQAEAGAATSESPALPAPAPEARPPDQPEQETSDKSPA